MQAWRAPQTSRLDASSSLHPTKILDNLEHKRSNLQGRQAWSFSSLQDQGGAPGLKSNCFQEASPLQFFDALEEVLPVEQELAQEAPHITQLQAEVASLKNDVEHLVLLIQSDSFDKGDHNILELRTQHVHNKSSECVRERACRDKPAKEDRDQEDPSKACSLEADKQKGEHNRVDFPEQQQEQKQKGQLRRDLSSKQQLEQRSVNITESTTKTPASNKNKQNSLQEEEAKAQRGACIARSAAYSAKPYEEQQLLRTKRCKICWKKSHDTQACWHNNQQPQQHHRAKAWKPTTRMQQQTAATSEHQLQQQACNNNLGIGEQQPAGSLEQQPLACRSPKRHLGQAWSILIDTGAELSVAPRSFADHIQLSPLAEAIELRTATGKAITTFGMRTVQLLSQG